MIVPDVNLLIYAYNSDAPDHVRAKIWWEALLTDARSVVGLPWAVALGFVRLMTHPSVLLTPWHPSDALAPVREWLALPQVEPLEPGPRHLEILERLLEAARVGGNLTTDAHLAAIAIEHQAELHSNDRDFGRFAGLRWVNPLAK